MTPKPSDGNDVTFGNSISGVSNCRTTKQMTSLNPETKLDKMGMFLKEYFDFQNSTSLT